METATATDEEDEPTQAVQAAGASDPRNALENTVKGDAVLDQPVAPPLKPDDHARLSAVEELASRLDLELGRERDRRVELQDRVNELEAFRKDVALALGASEAAFSLLLGMIADLRQAGVKNAASLTAVLRRLADLGILTISVEQVTGMLYVESAEDDEGYVPPERLF